MGGRLGEGHRGEGSLRGPAATIQAHVVISISISRCDLEKNCHMRYETDKFLAYSLRYIRKGKQPIIIRKVRLKDFFPGGSYQILGRYMSFSIWPIVFEVPL